MTPGRRQQIETLYGVARTRPEHTRDAFLRQVCAGDELLHREVTARLDQAASADGFLKSQGVDTAVDEVRWAAGSLEGQRLGLYDVGRLLGAGGMGEVYEARDTRLDRKVAIKVLPNAFAADPERLARFEREARLAAALNHPNICTIHEVGEADGRVFIAMEFVDGRPLRDVLPAHGLSNDETLRYGVQIADALAHAHEHAIVHRDLKTANVMVTAEGRVKVLDFGLAKRVGGSEFDDLTRSTPVSLTAPGVVAGTVPYVAPEQLRGQPADVRSDTWALGVILYEMVGGRRPFAGHTTFELTSAILNEPPPRLPPKVLPALSAVIERCLEKEPARRYQRTEEARAVLETIQDMRHNSRVAVPSRRTVLRRSMIAAVVFVLAVAGVLAGWFLKRNADLRRAEDGIAQITQFAERDDFAAALALARDVERIIPNDPRLSSLLRRVSVTQRFDSVPAGADVYIKRWDAADGEWELVGRTPIAEARLPRGLSRWKIQKDGFQPLEFIGPPGRGGGPSVHLRPNDSAPQMVKVPTSNGRLYQRLRYYYTDVSVPLAEFLIDKYEVTNEQFKQFVDAGGYTKREYWAQPFVRDGKTVTWEQAMAAFRDGTGRPGPSTWQAGAYPVGQSQYPVAGVSWYEAVAYARFVGKSLPTIYHWVAAASPEAGAYIAPLSNIEGKGLLPVGSRPGVSPVGTFDVAGNVREWAWNELTPGSRVMLGGAWTDPAYYFQEVVARSPFDRSDANGFRLVQYSDSGALADTLTGPIPPASRDYSKEMPVSDEVFRTYQNLFAYDPQPLDAKVESIDRGAEQWGKEKVSFAAAYNGERVPAYLFLPRNARPPYQTVVFFPGAGASNSLSSDALPTGQFDFLLLSGRAVLYPVYKGTYERRFDDSTRPAVTSRAYSTFVMQFTNDIRRSLDYLETRQDIQKSGFAYYGFSWGAAAGPHTLALEPRFKAALFVVGGLQPFKPSPEVDDFNFAPRVKVPVLMLNGDSDSTFPVDASQTRLFTLLGTPSEHKRHVKYPGGHEVAAMRHSQVAREVLDWLDRYLGPVER